MINFRYHVVSIAAIFLALAVGVALGSGPLDNAKNIIGDNTPAVVKTSDLTSFDAAYAKKTAPALIKDKLKGQSVMVFTAPGARTAEVNGLKAAMVAGGAQLAGQVSLTSKLLDSAGRQFAEGVAQQSAKGVGGVATSGDSFIRIGSALGRAYLSDKPGPIDTAGTTIAAAFAEGNLTTAVVKPTQLASIALIVVGPESSGSDTTRGQADIVAQLANAFDVRAKGVVVAGPSESSTDGGYLQAVRAGDTATKVSSIDVSDSPAGQMLTVLVAAREITDRAGAFGTSRSADGAFPN